MRALPTRAGLLAGAALSTLLLPSCLIGSNTSTTVSGTYVGEGTFDQVEVGDSEGHVVALFGPPTSTTDIDDDSRILRWEYEEERRNEGHVFLLINAESRRENQSSVSVIVKDGVVDRIWRD